MGLSVDKRRYRKKSTPHKDSLLPPIFLLSKFLTFIGTPFYHLLTVAIVVLYTFIVVSGQTAIGLAKLLFKTTILLKRIRPKKSKKRRSKHVFSFPLKLPKLSFPSFTLPTFQFSPKIPKLPTLPSLPSFTRLFLILTLPAVILSLTLWFFILKDLPKPKTLATRLQPVTTKIYDRNGTLLFKIYRNQNRTIVPLNAIPQHVKESTLAIEDADFYTHPGFSLRGITRALYKNTTQGELSGGSTITQQLVKNALLSSEKTLWRKIKELVLSIQVELVYDKDTIFEMYLNEVSYGGSSYGIEEAAQLYFDKGVSDLNLAEAALLAGLPRAPTTYSPFGANPQYAKGRQGEVLNKMVEQGFISEEENTAAQNQTLSFAPQKTDIKAPHFVMYVKQHLVEKYGEQMVEEGGLEVVTSLDLGIQEMAEKIVASEVDKIRRLRINNGAAIVTNPKTGEVLAMVGSYDYFDQKNSGNFNVTTGLRQPGSSIKPINYSYALENGLYTASSMVSDTPITYRLSRTETYSPRNYDNSFRGPVTLRTALASSLNVPAVKVLASYGVTKMIDHATKMGITTWEDPSRYGLSLTLGGGEVKMADMAVAYSSFANYGQKVSLNPILEITNVKGEVIEKAGCSPDSSPLEITKAHAAQDAFESCGIQVIKPATAFIVANILSDNNARSPVFGHRSLLVIPNHPEVAVKTGTTQNLRDNWAIGFTQNLFVATWVGNNDNTPMAFVASGVTGATPIWHKIMSNLLKDQPSFPWEVPQGVVKSSVCLGSESKEYFIAGTEPKKKCLPKVATPEGQISSIPQQSFH